MTAAVNNPILSNALEIENIAWSAETESALLIQSGIGMAPLSDDHRTRGKSGFKSQMNHLVNATSR